MGYTVIAPVGDNLKALFIGMKEFPTDKVVLLSPSANVKEARKLSEKLSEFTIESEIIELGSGLMEETFRVFGELCSVNDSDSLIVNVATGDRLSTCAALSAAFANGLKAFGVMDNQPVLMPILKLCYYNELSENKLKILQELKSGDWVALQELSRRLKMSVSLLSYHINGNYKYKGLKEFRVIEVKEQNKNLLVKLSEMGALLLKGYVPGSK